ncbi:MAG: hypothetical protein HY819_06075 [Acidobacteria bacterium]|nr:hypothetical protein [Acidobacteriota bacterium]
MSIADVIAVVTGLILLAIAFPALFSLITLTFPQLTERTQIQIKSSPLGNILIGFVIFLIMAILVVVFFNIPGPTKLLALIIFLATLSIAMIGGAGLVNQIASKYEVFSHSQKSVSNIFYSTFFLEFALLLPFVGWFVVLPITFCLMLGAGSKTLLLGSKNKPQVSSKSQDNPLSNVELHPAS